MRTTAAGAAVTLDDGTSLDADVAVVCAGPGTPDLLPGIGLEVPLCAFLEQVVHLGRAEIRIAATRCPCLFDGPAEARSRHLRDADARGRLQDRHRQPAA